MSEQKQIESGCPACAGRRLHTTEEWKYHPFAGHGYTREQGYTHSDLAAQAEAARINTEKAAKEKK